MGRKAVNTVYTLFSCCEVVACISQGRVATQSWWGGQCVYIVQTVGDAMADMLAVELILAYRDWSVETWNKQYTDLPNRQAKIHVSLSICLSGSMSTCLSACLSLCLSVSLCVCLSVSVCLVFCLSTCLSVWERIIKDKLNVLFYLLPAKHDVQLTTRLRCARQYPTIYARTNRYKNSFILFGVNCFQWCDFAYFVYAWFSCMFV